MTIRIIALFLILINLASCGDNGKDKFITGCSLLSEQYKDGILKYNFNSKHQVIEMSDYDSADLSKPYTFLFEYDAGGNLILAKSASPINTNEYLFTYKKGILDLVKNHLGSGDTQYTRYHFVDDKISKVEQLKDGKVVGYWKIYWNEDNVIKVESYDSDTGKVSGFIDFLNYDTKRNIKSSVKNTSYIAFIPKSFGDLSKNNYRKVVYDGDPNTFDNYVYEYNDDSYVTKSTFKNQFNEIHIHTYTWQCY